VLRDSLKFHRRFNLLASTLLLAVWALLYLPHLRTSPSWYGDEGLALTAGLNLIRGIPAHGSFWNTFWNAYAPYQPGYELLIGWASALAGNDILGGRFVNALLALATAFALAFGGRKIMGPILALGSALLFLTYEQSVIHFRWIFTHNLIALGFAIAFPALCGKRTLRADLTAGFGLALGALALPLALYGFLAAALLVIRHPRSWIPVLAPYATVTLASLATALILFPGTGFLWTDLRDTAAFYANASRENSGGLGVFTNLLRFFIQDGFHAIGFLMLLVCLRGKTFALGFGGLVIAFLLLQNRQNLTIFYYQAILLTPLLALACGAGLHKLLGLLRKTGSRLRWPRLAIRFAPLFVSTIFFLSILPASLRGTLVPRIAYWTTQSIPEVEAAAAWINSRTSPDDLVLCHQNIAWLLHARTADHLQATTWLGHETWPFKTPLRRDQFRFAPDPAEARFVVIADIDRRWTFAQPNVFKLLERYESENWPVVWSGEHYIVIENPVAVGAAR
jgi:hypothetical protein